MKKTLICILVAAMVSAGALILGGCGNNADDSGLANVEMLMIHQVSGDGREFLAREVFRDRFGVNVTFNLVPGAGYFDNLNLLVAANDLPDIMSPLPDTMAKDLGPRGALVAITEHLDRLPNARTFLESDPIVFANLMARDGHIYNLPLVNENINFQWVPIIRRDLLDAAGLDVPTDFEELANALRAIRENDPANVGWVSRDGINVLRGLGNAYGVQPGMFYCVNSDEWLFGPSQPQFRRMIEDMAQLWDEGLLDREFFTASRQQWEERITTGRSAFMLDFPDIADAHNRMAGHAINLEVIMPLSFGGARPQVEQVRRVSTWSAWGISARTRHLDEILQIADFMYSDEGSVLFQWGEQDVHHTIGDDGKLLFLPHIVAPYNPEGTLDVRERHGITADHLMRFVQSNGISRFTPQTDATLAQFTNQGVGFELNNNIILTFTQEEARDISRINNDLVTFVNESMIRFITGAAPMSEFDDFIAQLDRFGARELETIHAEAYARYKEALATLR